MFCMPVRFLNYPRLQDARLTVAVPFRFTGLYEIGLVFFFLNIFLYLVIWIMILTRFFLYPSSFKESFTHPTESLFIAAFAVSFGTLLITVDEYGANRTGPWLNEAIFVLFWFDAALALFLSLATYMILWSTQTFTIAQMTPIWIFPAYPLLIVGPHAAQLSGKLASTLRAVQVIVGGFTIQGIGYLVSLTIYSAFVYRLMTHKLPAERLRPGMFISVGPSAFTASALIGMSENLETTMATWNNFMDVPGPLAAQILRLTASWTSLWLWGAAIWFFCIALVSNMQCFRREHHVPFAMTWFSFVFPQTALTTSTFAIARAFELFPLQIVGCAMTIMLVLVYLFVLSMMVRAVFRHDILWPEKGEDKEEGGFKRAVSLSLPPDIERAISRISTKSKTKLDSKDACRDTLEQEAMYQNMANGDGQADEMNVSQAETIGAATPVGSQPSVL